METCTGAPPCNFCPWGSLVLHGNWRKQSDRKRLEQEILAGKGEEKENREVQTKRKFG